MSQRIINKRSSVITEDGKPKLPSSDAIDYGEIAINYADGVETLSIKNSVNEIIEFKSKEYVDNLVDNNKELYYIDFEYYQTDFNRDKLEELNNLAKRDDILIVTKIQNQLVIAIPSPYDENSSAYKAVSFRMIIGSDTYNSTTYGNEPKIRILTFTFIYEYGIGHHVLNFDKEIVLYTTGDGTKFLSDDGTYKTINVDTSAIEQRIDGVETTIEENELVTSTALNELNARMTDVETNKASSTHDHDDRYLKEHQDISHLATQDELDSKQDTLVSGTNIKTINGQSILGSGNIEIETSGSTVDLSNYSTTEQVQAMIDASIITALNTEV